MLDADHVLVARRGDEDVGRRDHILEQHHLEPVHRGLQRANRIDLGHLDARPGALQRRCRALAHIAVTADDSNLAGHHRVGGAADAVDQRFLAAVLVVELRLGDRVVDVDRREGQLAVLVQVVQTMHAGRGFLGHALDGGLGLGEPAGRFLDPLLDLQLDDLFLFGLRHGQHILTRLHPRAEQHIERSVAAIVEDHVRAFGEHERPVQIVPVLGQALALDGKHRDAGGGNRRSRVVLRRKDVARRPTDISPQRHQRFDQGGRLDRHVQRADNSGTLERFAVPELLAARHQTRHFRFGDHQLLATKFSQPNVLDDVILRHQPHSLIRGLTGT